MFTQLRNTLLATLLAIAATTHAAPAPTVINLWPGTAPGEKGDIGEEKDMSKPTDGKPGGKSIIRLGNVSNPTITIYAPEADKANGTAVVVCPGGGYNILAYDLEGTEICDWLNSIGVTGVLLKYRVPKRAGLEKHTAPLQDVQRAIGLVRSRAQEWHINPARIGVLGFSAGGHLAASASNNYTERTYPHVDAADDVSCRPDFSVLIYPAYLTANEGRDKNAKWEPTIAPDLPVTSKTPPTFIVMAEDDPVHVENALFYALALKNAKVPCELHVYAEGGHGYGLRPNGKAVTTWPQRAADWMGKSGLLEKP
jgi:acetyl esterase/lipase